MNTDEFVQERENVFVHKDLYEEQMLSEIKIWRYMDLCKFFSLWRGVLYLANRKEMSDRREMGVRVYQKGDNRIVNPFTELQISGNKRCESSARVADFFAFINCWCVSEHESYTLWSTYLKGLSGIAIQSSLQSLINSIKEVPKEKVYISKVQYVEKFPVIFNQSQTLFLKHVSYQDENELRLGMLSDNQNAKRLLIDPNVLIESIYISPLLNDSMQKELFLFFKNFLGEGSITALKYSDIVM